MPGPPCPSQGTERRQRGGRVGELSSLFHMQPSWLASQPPEPWGAFQSLWMKTINLLPLPLWLRSRPKLRKEHLPSKFSYPKSTLSLAWTFLTGFPTTAVTGKACPSQPLEYLPPLSQTWGWGPRQLSSSLRPFESHRHLGPMPCAGVRGRMEAVLNAGTAVLLFREWGL